MINIAKPIEFNLKNKDVKLPRNINRLSNSSTSNGYSKKITNKFKRKRNPKQLNPLKSDYIFFILSIKLHNR